MSQKVKVSVPNHINSNMNNNTTNVNKNLDDYSNNEGNNDSPTNKKDHNDSSDNPSVIKNIYNINISSNCNNRGVVKLGSKKSRRRRAKRARALIATAQKAAEEEMISAGQSVSASSLPWGIAEAHKAAHDKMIYAGQSASVTSLSWGIAREQKAAYNNMRSASLSVSVNCLPLGKRGDVASHWGGSKRLSQPTSPADDNGEPLNKVRRREESNEGVKTKLKRQCKRAWTAKRLPLDPMWNATGSQQRLKEVPLLSFNYCIFCGQDVNNNNLRHHLAKFHWSQCFRCAVCEEQGGLHGEACFTSSAEAEAHARQQHQIYGLELDNVILPPLSLFLITCHFCVPLPRHFLGGPLAALQSQLVLHLPRHEDVHRGRQYIIDSQVRGRCVKSSVLDPD